MYTRSGEPIYPLGIGSRHIGGVFQHTNGGTTQVTQTQSDIKEIRGIQYALSKGSNYVDVCHHYGYGKSVALIAQALEGHHREHLWINAKLEDHYHSLDEVVDSCYRYCSLLKTPYLDSFQIHAPMQHLNHRLVVKVVNELITNGMVRYLSVSNFNKEQLKELIQWRQRPPISHEINYNLVTRVNEENEVIATCDNNKINIIAYQPLKRNSIAQANYPLLHSLATQYGKTQNQILLNRLCLHKGYVALNKSTNPIHIDENHDALTFLLKEQEYRALDAFRPEGYVLPDYDYWGNNPHKPKIRKL